MNKEFLYTLLDNMSVSGHEISLQKKVIEEMTSHCDKIMTDYTGNVTCILNPDADFKVMLAGHIDEIGLTFLTFRLISTIHREGEGRHRHLGRSVTQFRIRGQTAH